MNLDLQLSELRRSLDVATTKIDGQLAVLLQKSDYAEKHARESAERVAAELAARDARLNQHEMRLDGHDALKGKMYFAAGMASAMSGAIAIVVQILTNKH